LAGSGAEGLTAAVFLFGVGVGGFDVDAIACARSRGWIALLVQGF